METLEKKSFLKAIREQISKYEEYIANGKRYIGEVGACPICNIFMIGIYGPEKSSSKCYNCPLLNFRIYDHPNVAYPCARRLTYPERIVDYIIFDRSTLIGHCNWGDLYKYEMEGEKAALQFWNKMLKFVQKTPAKQIDLSENSPFVMQMVWIDKVIARDWKIKIDNKYKIIENTVKKVINEG